MEGALLNSSHRRLERRPGEIGGFAVSVTVERVLGSMNVIMVLDGAPGTEVRMTPAEIKGADPGKLIIRLENRLSGLESLRSRSLSEIGQLTTEAAHARDDIARPFPQTDQLAAARDRVLRLEEKLRETAAPSRGDGNDWLLAAAMHDAAAMAGIPTAPQVPPPRTAAPRRPAGARSGRRRPNHRRHRRRRSGRGTGPRQRGPGWVRPSARMVRTRATSSWRPQGRRRHAPGCRRGR
jgi:hypothetical protein